MQCVQCVQSGQCAECVVFSVVNVQYVQCKVCRAPLHQLEDAVLREAAQEAGQHPGQGGRGVVHLEIVC